MYSPLLPINERTFFTFPHASRDKERCLQWVSACGNPSLLKIPFEKLKNNTLCKKHFPVSSFIFKRLSRSAIPTLELPGNLLHYYLSKLLINVSPEN